MPNAASFFKNASLYTDNVDYLLVSLPPRGITVAAGILAELGEPFSTLIVDKDEVTLLIPAETLEDFQKRLRDAAFSEPYRLITLDIELPSDLTGFMAHVARLLGDAKIPIIPLGAFRRDHLLVPARHFERAWQVLKEAQQA